MDNLGQTMYGSVTWMFNSFNVITETTPKITKAVAPNEDWGDKDMNNRWISMGERERTSPATRGVAKKEMMCTVTVHRHVYMNRCFSS